MHHFRFWQQCLPLALALSAFDAPIAAQLTHVIPNGLANTEGNTSNLFPWGRGNNSIRILFNYNNGNFTSASINTPIVITRLRWRADGAPASWTGGTYGSVQVDLSTAATVHNAPLANFASNHGPDLTRVHDGPVTVLPGTTTGIGPGPWFVDLPLTTPFLYDPGSGSGLAVEVQFDATTWGGGSSAFLDIQSTNSLTSRVFNSTAWPATTGSLGQNHGAVMEVSYAPALGLHAGFRADVLSGPSPLVVQFTDLSHSSDPNGVTTRLWDLDGDGVIDSTARNPVFTYTGCGSYDVELTVFDGSHPLSSLRRNSYITTDVVRPSFTWSVAGPNTLQFQDTSTPTPTSWAWDLDGDGITDSTAQNPTWTYPRGCTVVPNVGLTVSRNCQGPFSKTSTIYVGDTLVTSYAGGAGIIPTWGSLMDLQVLSPEGISLCALSVSGNSALGSLFSVDVYLTPGSYVGKEANPAPWRLLGTANGTVAGVNVPSLASFPASIYLPPGNYGLALYPTGTGFTLSNGASTQGNADLAVTHGAYRTDLFGNGGIFGQTTANRTWNGSFHYTTVSRSGEAGHGFFGAGCAGSLGVPRQLPTTAPRLGGSLSGTYTNLPQDLVVALIGFSRSSSAFGALPLDLAVYGAPGCNALVSSEASLVLLGSGGSANYSVAVPTSSAYLGVMLYTQGLALDLAANALGAVMSDANASIFGQ